MHGHLLFDRVRRESRRLGLETQDKVMALILSQHAAFMIEVREGLLEHVRNIHAQLPTQIVGHQQFITLHDGRKECVENHRHIASELALEHLLHKLMPRLVALVRRKNTGKLHGRVVGIEGPNRPSIPRGRKV